MTKADFFTAPCCQIWPSWGLGFLCHPASWDARPDGGPACLPRGPTDQRAWPPCCGTPRPAQRAAGSNQNVLCSAQPPNDLHVAPQDLKFGAAPSSPAVCPGTERWKAPGADPWVQPSGLASHGPGPACYPPLQLGKSSHNELPARASAQER